MEKPTLSKLIIIIIIKTVINCGLQLSKLMFSHENVNDTYQPRQLLVLIVFRIATLRESLNFEIF